MSALFERVKEEISPEEAAKFYGLRVERRRARCPFHNDHDPSLSFYGKTFRCFACGEKGDVVTFVARLFSLTPYEAAQKLAADFGLSAQFTPYEEASFLRRRRQEEEALAWCRARYEECSGAFKRLRQEKAALQQTLTPKEDPPPRLLALWAVENPLQDVLERLTVGSEEELLALYRQERKEVEALAAHIRHLFGPPGS